MISSLALVRVTREETDANALRLIHSKSPIVGCPDPPLRFLLQIDNDRL